MNQNRAIDDAGANLNPYQKAQILHKLKRQIFSVNEFSDGESLVPLYSSKVSAGFPSPADDYIDDKIDLNKYLIPHPASTFFVIVEGNSMIDAGIKEGDLLIIDKSLDPVDGSIVVVVIDGELTVKKLNKKSNGEFNLLPANSQFDAIEVGEYSNTCIWGVVRSVIHQV